MGALTPAQFKMINAMRAKVTTGLHGPVSLEVGRYTGRIEAIEFGTDKKGTTPQLAWNIRVKGPNHIGVLHKKFNRIKTDTNIGFLAGDCETLGGMLPVECETWATSLNKQFKGKLVSFDVKQGRDEYTNTDFVDLLPEDGGTASNAGDKEAAASTGNEKAEVAEAEAEPETPDAEPTEEPEAEDEAGTTGVPTKGAIMLMKKADLKKLADAASIELKGLDLSDPADLKKAKLKVIKDLGA